MNITGSGNNLAANSANVSQRTTVTMTAENSRQLLGLADSLALLTSSGLLGLNDEQAREAALVVDSLRESAEQNDAPGTEIQTLLDRVKEVALAGTGTAIGQASATTTPVPATWSPSWPGSIVQMKPQPSGSSASQQAVASVRPGRGSGSLTR